MNNIQEKDIVRLTRNVNHELQQGLVGIVLQCHQNYFDVQFPLQGKSLYAQLPVQDVEFLMGSKMK
ncbi:hypothetical protein H6G76_17695 [Nostoc sp. FACHB-152]|uniref:hypothetical protein n=1 Tax=unclassified Nostoc TaxID=2593658 RepID=UPI0016864327|nr:MULTISPECIES: hypothetical protein [unclassified Nostoc]MBD2448954.1 hypothetical protein [Nostoc sp. FACHB-152]MBD2469422.1 hypothetical protein [Nostoc sp. FACHB-145]